MRELLAMRARRVAIVSRGDRERIEAAEARGGPSTPAPPPGIAIIPVWGVVGHRANELRDISSRVGTSTEMLADQIAPPSPTRTSKAIVLDINSPGGGVYGVPEVADFIRSQRGKKPDRRRVERVGGVRGVLDRVRGIRTGRHPVRPGRRDRRVLDSRRPLEGARRRRRQRLTDSAGKFKAEDNPFGPLTEEARKRPFRSASTAIFRCSCGDVARGRGVALDAVRNGFGEGRVVGAKEAVAMKMADRVGTLEDVVGDLLNPDRLAALGSAAFSAENRLELAADDAETAEIAAQVAETAVEAAAAPAALETDNVRNRRLRLRLLELGG
jgi:ClpP class serine protease